MLIKLKEVIIDSDTTLSLVQGKHNKFYITINKILANTYNNLEEAEEEFNNWVKTYEEK